MASVLTRSGKIWITWATSALALFVAAAAAPRPAVAQGLALSTSHVLWTDFGHLYAYDLAAKKKKRLIKGSDGDGIATVAARGDTVAVTGDVIVNGDPQSSDTAIGSIELFDPKTRVRTPFFQSTTNTRLDCGSARGDLAVSSRGEVVIEMATRERRECGHNRDHDFLAAMIRAADGSITHVPLGNGPARGYLEQRFGDGVDDNHLLELESDRLVRNTDAGVEVNDLTSGGQTHFRNGGRYIHYRSLSDDGVLLTVDSSGNELLATTRSLITSGEDVPIRKTPRGLSPSQFEFCGNRLIAAGERSRGFEVIELSNGTWRRIALFRQPRGFVCDQLRLVSFIRKYFSIGSPTDFREFRFR